MKWYTDAVTGRHYCVDPETGESRWEEEVRVRRISPLLAAGAVAASTGTPERGVAGVAAWAVSGPRPTPADGIRVAERVDRRVAPEREPARATRGAVALWGGVALLAGLVIAAVASGRGGGTNPAPLAQTPFTVPSVTLSGGLASPSGSASPSRGGLSGIAMATAPGGPTGTTSPTPIPTATLNPPAAPRTAPTAGRTVTPTAGRSRQVTTRPPSAPVATAGQTGTTLVLAWPGALCAPVGQRGVSVQGMLLICSRTDPAGVPYRGGGAYWRAG